MSGMTTSVMIKHRLVPAKFPFMIPYNLAILDDHDPVGIYPQLDCLYFFMTDTMA